jgi:NADH-quinone oxidoreductase subunit J
MTGVLSTAALTHGQVVLAAGLKRTSTGEEVQFWFLAIIAVLGGMGMVAARKAVHSALCLAATMICLAVMYLAQGAYFLGIVQIVVYTGAIMMLFLFVLMLVGVDSSDSLVETIKGQRLWALVAGLGFGILLVAGLANAHVGPFAGTANTNAAGNVPGLAVRIFSDYYWAFEVTSALLITAALGAMVLAHRERTSRRKTQGELARERVAGGGQLGPLPTPGVFARHNAADVPALLPDGSVSELSVNRMLAQRVPVRDVPASARPPEQESIETTAVVGSGEQGAQQ